MRPRTTLAVLLVVLVLAALIVVVEIDRPGTKERAEEDRRLVPSGFERHALARVEYRTASGTIVLERTGERRWRIAEPLADVARAGRVESIVGALLEAEVLARVPLREITDSLGDPTLSLTLASETRALFSLEVFEQRLAGSHAYARVTGGQDVVLVPLSLVSRLSPSLAELRETRLAPFRAQDVTRFEIDSREGPALAFSREGAGWRIDAPFRDEADTSRVKEVLDALLGLQADVFAPRETVSGEAVDEAWLRARFLGENGSALPSIVIGAIAPEAPVRRWSRVEGRPGRLRVDPRALGRLLQAPPESWRSNLVLDFAPSRASKILIETRGDSVELVREGETWTAAGDAPLDQARVRESILRLSRIEARRVVRASGPPDGDRIARVTVTLADAGLREGRVLELTLFEAPGRERLLLARRAGRDPIFEVAAAPFRDLDTGSLTVSNARE